MSRLSIILPCYNVEKYIAQCLDSMLKQDIPHSEYEIVCVNDCSPDNSEAIVRQYMQQYPNIRLIKHEENRRLGGARNTGLKYAKGEYVWFVDSDDTIRPNTLKKLLSALDENLDVLLFNYEIVDELLNSIKEEYVVNDVPMMTGRDFVHHVFGDSFVYHLGYVWRMCCRTEYLYKNNICFLERVYWEDTVFFPKAILFAESVKSIRDIIYQYRQNQNSICATYNREIRADLIAQFSFDTGKELLDFADEYRKTDPMIGDSLRKKAMDGYINGNIISLLRTSSKERRNYYKLIKQSKYQHLIKQLKPNMTILNRWVLNDFFGQILIHLLSVGYKIKKKW